MKQVTLYFDNHLDALHFTLAASSIIAGEHHARQVDSPVDVSGQISRATRILVEDIAVPAQE
jgi:hypothetical protein